MAGLLVFRTVADALRAGFTVYDRTPDGYLVKRKNANGLWELAIVEMRSPDRRRVEG